MDKPKHTFTAGTSTKWVTRDTVDDCAEAYVELAKEHKLGMGTIYRTEDPMGKRYYINAQGAIFE